jgi:hypothetical protein
MNAQKLFLVVGPNLAGEFASFSTSRYPRRVNGVVLPVNLSDDGVQGVDEKV